VKPQLRTILGSFDELWPEAGRFRRRIVRRLRGWPNLEALERDGMRIGHNVFVGGGTILDPDFAFLISIGDDSIVSLGVIVLAHDASTRRHIGYSRVAPVTIGRRVFIGARSVVLPGVTIGDDAIIGAGSVVRRDVDPGMVVAGNPAQTVATTEEYIARHRAALDRRPRWTREYRASTGITPDERDEMRALLEDGEAFVA
jgi:maltose O-acetyltransferase